jgi:hypothetical protein
MKQIKLVSRIAALATMLITSGAFAQSTSGNIGKPPPSAVKHDVIIQIGNGTGKPPKQNYLDTTLGHSA